MDRALGSALWPRPASAGPLASGQMAVREPERVEHVRPAPRPPDPVALGRSRPGRTSSVGPPGWSMTFFSLQVDERQLVGVVTAGGDERMAVVGQRDDVQRQVRQRDVLPGGLQGPPVGQEKSLRVGPAYRGASWARPVNASVKANIEAVIQAIRTRTGIPRRLIAGSLHKGVWRRAVSATRHGERSVEARPMRFSWRFGLAYE